MRVVIEESGRRVAGNRICDYLTDTQQVGSGHRDVGKAMHARALLHRPGRHAFAGYNKKKNCNTAGPAARVKAQCHDITGICHDIW